MTSKQLAALERASDALSAHLATLEPFERLEAAKLAGLVAAGVVEMVAEARRAAVRDLRAQGFTLAVLSEMTGLSMARISQLEVGKTLM